MMATVNWGIKDIKSQHSPYVDTLLQVWSPGIFSYVIAIIQCISMQDFKRYKEQIDAIEK